MNDGRAVPLTACIGCSRTEAGSTRFYRPNALSEHLLDPSCAVKAAVWYGVLALDDTRSYSWRVGNVSGSYGFVEGDASSQTQRPRVGRSDTQSQGVGVAVRFRQDGAIGAVASHEATGEIPGPSRCALCERSLAGWTGGRHGPFTRPDGTGGRLGICEPCAVRACQWYGLLEILEERVVIEDGALSFHQGFDVPPKGGAR